MKKLFSFLITGTIVLGGFCLIRFMEPVAHADGTDFMEQHYNVMQVECCEGHEMATEKTLFFSKADQLSVLARLPAKKLLPQVVFHQEYPKKRYANFTHTPPLRTVIQLE